ncbi:uncharacterized protein PODANS_4_3680, partial [Podospora anserina S mat+]
GKSRPQEQEQLLGDVAISDGILQHDLGRKLVGRFVPETKLLEPGVEIRGVLVKLRTEQAWELLQTDVASNLEVLKGKIWSSGYPGTRWDSLFRSDYLHKNRGEEKCEECAGDDGVCMRSIEMTCQQLGCNETETVIRRRLDYQSGSIIHIGRVGSGDTVMRLGKDRDEIVERDGIIAFEMEGAGVWETFPNCLVIKGICDYAHRHKNKQSQGYAAATATAVAKSFLRSRKAGNFPAEAHGLLDVLFTTPYLDRKNRNPDVVQADPGCGKSVLAKHLVEDVIPTTTARKTCYFLFKDDVEDQKTMNSALSCVLHQLYLILRASRAHAPEQNRSMPDLSFILTSRPLQAIRREFQLRDSPGSSVIHLRGESQEEIQKISDEINIFIRARVQSVPHRTYLWAHLILDLIEKAADIDKVGDG